MKRNRITPHTARTIAERIGAESRNLIADLHAIRIDIDHREYFSYGFVAGRIAGRDFRATTWSGYCTADRDERAMFDALNFIDEPSFLKKLSNHIQGAQ